MSRQYFDPNLGDEIILTCTLPKWARTEDRQAVFATLLCSLAQATGATREANSEKLCWFMIDDIAMHTKGQSVVCVFVRGNEPEPEDEGEVNLDNLLGEDDGSDHTPPSV